MEFHQEKIDKEKEGLVIDKLVDGEIEKKMNLILQTVSLTVLKN